ncbi:TlpA disulfide reductase family protein [Niabella beijingensis]|uniref:TlpA disulfide reductase family protein n=1 Tax=Niabella beijingensis TaxID=2872700 RepID=UPI001CBECCCD|nr:TlpA disulfide reductase family protein [Niabella beijingensis]MBZ4192545.1 TlpA family protein disulfide reductase [Niabella beijingensis]
MRPLFLLLFLICITDSGKAGAQSVPPIKLNTLNTRINNGRDTVFIINFWASWCTPCLRELPHFETFNNRFKQSKVKVLLVSLDFKSDLDKTVLPLVKKLELKNEVFLLDESDAQTYMNNIDTAWSGALPATLIVNKAKNKRKFHEGTYDFNDLVKIYHQNK